MAISLTINLTDQEQAAVAALVDRAAPGASPQQILNWAEKQCKRGLREAVLRKYAELLHDELVTEQSIIEVQLLNDFPEVPE